MNRSKKNKLVVFYEEDNKVLEKIEKENINFNRLVKSLLLEWYYKGIK